MLLNNFQSPGDVAFSVFGFNIYYYGIVLAIAVFAGFFASYKLFKIYYNQNQADKLIDFSPYLIIIGIIGARLYYCLVNFSYYLYHPIEIFNIRQGGLSIHGMIFAGIAGLYIFSRVYNIQFRKLADTFLCGSILAQSIGRWGNFFNSEAFGYPTTLPWKLYIPVANRPEEYVNYSYFHPTFLYESILDFFIFIILLLLFKKLSKNPGVAACLYLILYSVVRLFVESIRIDSALDVGGFHIAQIISIALIFIGILLSTYLLKKA